MNSFNPEIQVKDTQCTIKNKLIYLFSKLRMFKLVTTLVLEFKKMESDDKTIYSTFYSNSKQKQFLMKVTLMMYLNQCILPLCQT